MAAVADLKHNPLVGASAHKPQRAKIRPKKYKKSLLSPEDTERIAQVVYSPLQDLKAALNDGHINPPEFCASYITTYLKEVRPNWKGGPHSHSELSSLSIPYPDLATFARHSLRSIPLAVNQSLCCWHQGSYDLCLFFDIPSPRRVLQMQCAGARCVTAITHQPALSHWVLGERDPLSFLLHDLVHAHHFFSKPSMMAAQIGFCRLMTLSLDSGVFEQLLEQDVEFKEELDYVLADMNSHGVHMVKYLKAIITKSVLRIEGRADGGQRLSREGEAFVEGVLEQVAKSWEAGQDLRQDLLSISTGQEDEALLQRLDDFLQQAASMTYSSS